MTRDEKLSIFWRKFDALIRLHFPDTSDIWIRNFPEAFEQFFCLAWKMLDSLERKKALMR